MRFNNEDIVLIIIYQKRDSENRVKFSDIEEVLPQEKSQISQALLKLAKKKFITKEPRYIRFKNFQITKEGIVRARQIIATMSNLINL